ncbi:hypothetical protein DL768_003909 [Monosporascus sp. mg162]|nr:hypothetical protein DL768_003909 [Monosporascus sp. mg162]
MSGAEVIGLISGIIAIVDATVKVYGAATDASGLPEAFRDVAKRLPLVQETLQTARGHLNTADPDKAFCNAIKPVLEDCEDKTKRLAAIFEKVVPQAEASRIERYLLAARTLGKGDTVESLMKGILDDVQLLTGNRVTKLPTEADIAHLIRGAIDEVSAIPPSLPAGRDLFISYDAERNALLKELKWTDPTIDKLRIERTKGGLYEAASNWILAHPSYHQWRHGETKLLWIKGGAGKGKTMLLVAITGKLQPCTKLDKPSADSFLSFFFCQNSDDRLNNAVAILKGLIYLLLVQDSSLVSYLKNDYDRMGKEVFDVSHNNANAFDALSNVFRQMVRHPRSETMYLAVDALDECEDGLPDLLNLIKESSLQENRLKWIVTSRNQVNVDQSLALSLEVNSEAVVRAIEVYIDHRVSQISSLESNPAQRATVQQKLLSKADGDDVVRRIDEIPSGLPPLYDRMMGDIGKSTSEYRDSCLVILSIAALAYRPLHILELRTLAGLEKYETADLEKIVDMCGSFLTPLESRVYPIHQSAKDYLVSEAAVGKIFPFGIQSVHRSIVDSIIRRLFTVEEPSWVLTKPIVEQDWSLCLQTLEGHGDSVTSVAFSPDSSRIASGSRDHTIKIWDAKSGKELRTLESHGDSVTSVAFSPDGSHIVSGSGDDTVKIWDAKSGKEVRTLKGHGSSVISVAFSPDGSRIVSGSSDGTLKIWDAKSGEDIRTLKGHGGSVTSVAFSPNGSHIGSGSGDDTVKIWDAKSGKEVRTLKGHGGSVTSVAFSPDGSHIASGSGDDTVKIWDAKSGKEVRTLEGYGGSVLSVAFSPDGSRIVSGSGGGTVKIWDAKSGKEVRTLKGHGGSVISVAFSPDGSRIVSGSAHCTVKIWDPKSGKEVRTLKGHGSWVNSVAFSPDGSRIASGSADRTVNIWDAKSGKEVRTLKGHGCSVISVAFSPDGNRIVSGSDDRTVKIWDAKSGKEVRTLKGHGGWVTSVAFSPEGSRIVSGSDDRTVKIWDAKSGKDVHTERMGHAVAHLRFKSLNDSGLWLQTDTGSILLDVGNFTGNYDGRNRVGDKSSLVIMRP